MAPFRWIFKFKNYFHEQSKVRIMQILSCITPNNFKFPINWYNLNNLTLFSSPVLLVCASIRHKQIKLFSLGSAHRKDFYTTLVKLLSFFYTLKAKVKRLYTDKWDSQDHFLTFSCSPSSSPWNVSIIIENLSFIHFGF